MHYSQCCHPSLLAAVSIPQAHSSHAHLLSVSFLPLLQVCNKVPVPKTKQVCNRICTKTTTMTEQIATEPTVVGGKGKGQAVMVTAGKGRKMLGAESAEMLPLLAAGHIAGKAMFAKAAGAVMATKAVAGAAVVSHAGKGKGMVMQAPQEDVQCNDVSVGPSMQHFQACSNSIANYTRMGSKSAGYDTVHCFGLLLFIQRSFCIRQCCADWLMQQQPPSRLRRPHHKPGWLCCQSCAQVLMCGNCCCARVLRCLQVCNDVQYNTYETQCQMVTNTKTKCDIIMQQRCDKVRAPQTHAASLVATLPAPNISCDCLAQGGMLVQLACADGCSACLPAALRNAMLTSDW
jgi:hypothetical protein